MRVLDFHSHLGFVPGSGRKSSKEFNITPQELSEHIIKYNITDIIVFYDVYSNIEALQLLVPNIKIIALQYIMDPVKSELDLDKPLFRGIKVHSHRSTTNNDSGTDYAGKDFVNLLNKLDNNHIVYYHTQNPTSHITPNYVRTIGYLALKFNYLKHIIGHAGAYGAGCYRPQINNYNLNETKSKTAYDSFFKTYMFAKCATAEAAVIAQELDNVFLDTSTYVTPKIPAMKMTNKWAVGSDYPFGSATMYNYDIQMSKWSKKTGRDPEEINKTALEWLDNLLKFKKLNTIITDINNELNESTVNW